MRKYANILIGEVFEIIETDQPIESLYHPDLVWVDITDIDPPPEQHWTASQRDGKWSFAAPSNE